MLRDKGKGLASLSPPPPTPAVAAAAAAVAVDDVVVAVSTVLRTFSPCLRSSPRSSLNPQLPRYYELIYILALTRVEIGTGGWIW